MTPICKNCDHPLEVSFTFCPACGQKAATGRLRITEILHDFWTQFTDIDKGFFRLLRDLVVHPGIVAKEYIAGRRKKHFGPLNFYLIVGTALIISMNITEWIHADFQQHNQKPNDIPASQVHPTDGITETVPGTTLRSGPSIPDETSSTNTSTSRKSKIQDRQRAVSLFWAKYSDFVSIAAAPFICIFFWLFYRRAGFNYTELLVACLYMIGFTNLIYALVFAPLTSAVSSSSQTTYVITGAFKLFEIAYFTFFYFQLTQQEIKRPLLHATISAVLVAVLWTMLTFALVATYIMTGFGLD